MGIVIVSTIGSVAAIGMLCILVSIITESDHHKFVSLHKDIVNDKFEDYRVNPYTVIIEESPQ
jgi:hypothetical protein